MPDHTLIDPFDIDDGELDGLAPQEVFVLGVEFARFLAALKDGHPFEMMIHTANAERFRNACARRSRSANVVWVHDDYAEWRTIQVGRG